MVDTARRAFLTRGSAALAGATLLPAAIQRALVIPARRRTGTLQDVEHIVVLTQENRSFDHYFGTYPGVRGFGDRFPIPLPDVPGRARKTVWCQANDRALDASQIVLPFHLDTQEHFELMRVAGTPHSLPDAQRAWAGGRLGQWPKYKRDHAMGYYTGEDLPFQFALAQAFTLCDAYHCAFHGGTNPNRVFLWTGKNDAHAEAGGPVIDNAYDGLDHDPTGGYRWTSYAERLEQAGVSWQIYQDMADNFTDNPLAGFRSFRAAYRGEAGAQASLAQRALSTRDLDRLKDDVLEGRLPQVSWIVATAEGSEHPGPSSPAQGAAYTARVLDALTADPDVWAKSILLINFDENDGFFDHAPPPAAPSYELTTDGAKLAGASTVSTDGEYHEHAPNDSDDARSLLHTPYGLGPRVPMYVVSPWSKGGYVHSEVLDHTSVIRLMEARFGVSEPNITAWRRAVCGDLTAAFDFRLSGDAEQFPELPDTSELEERAQRLGGTATPSAPLRPELPVQTRGVRPSRALPYELHVHADATSHGRALRLSFVNSGRAGAVFHVYDRRALARGPRRYTVGAGERLADVWHTDADGGAYDLWVLGPNGFHRHFTGRTGASESAAFEIAVSYVRALGNATTSLINRGVAPRLVDVRPNAYYGREAEHRILVPGHSRHELPLSLQRSASWYDFTVRIEGVPEFTRRFAGRVETGRASYTDPALGGQAITEQA